MTALTVPTVAGWRPGELLAAADRLAAAAVCVDDDARAVRRHLADAVAGAGGAWAATAASRADQEARRGEALAEALGDTAAALRDGAARLAHARDRLLDAVDRARAAGVEVTPEGRVLSLVTLAPLDQLALSPEEREAEQRVADRCAGHEAAVLAALADVAATDEAVAGVVAAVDLPATWPSMVEAHRVRTILHGGDPVAGLGPAGGAVVVGRAVHEGRSLVTRGRLLAEYASLASQGAPRPALEEARRAFAFGTSATPVLKVAERVSLPATILSGAEDAVTGGGYDGVRGWATRGFGAAGAAGAGVVLAGSALAPALVVAGGGAVLAYGAWSAGNYVVDHWDQVEDAWDAADEWADQQRAEACAELGEAVVWAHEQLAAAGSGTVDMIGELF